jgi:hypothetical protein
MKLGTHMPDGERRKCFDIEVVYQVLFRSDISFLKYRAETKQVSNFCSICRRCDLDLCPTNLNILGTHMPDGDRRKPVDIEVCMIKVKVTTSKNRRNI